MSLSQVLWLRVTLVLLFFLTAAIGSAPSKDLPLLSPVFGDHMVLQRGKPNTFWGWAAPGSSVTVRIGERNAVATADSKGRWELQIEPPKVGSGYTVQVEGPTLVELRNVAVGDVWLCGGQSNMEWALARAKDGEREVAAADHPDIRFFKVQARSAYAPVDVPVGTWKVCTPANVKSDGLSAVAFYFARRVQRETGVPIGLVQAALGGTPAETWMDPATTRRLPEFAPAMAEIDRLRAAGAPSYGNFIMHWYDEYDAGIRGTPWSDDKTDDREWKTVPLLTAFEQLGLAEFPALVWFRKEIVLPDPLPSGDAVLRLGVVEKMETSFVNGVWVGASSWVENPRAYRVPASILRPGRNVITLRVLKLKSANAFLSPAVDIRLSLPGGADLPLAGDWKAAVSVDARPPHPLPLGYENYPIMPSVLFEGMLRPVAPLALAGALWYQGEANTSRADQYRTLLPAMIGDWRAAFRQRAFPFYIVGLPAFQERKDTPSSDGWAELRAAQALTAATVPNTGLAVTIDLGDPKDIHPTDKQPVGERLALIALKTHYGKTVVHQGPTYRAKTVEGSAVRIHFDNTDGGLETRGEKLGEFSVAGADGVWHWATAKIDGETVVVSSPDVPNPKAVRYAWQSNPLATLFNGAGLPACPFSTDTAPWSAAESRAQQP